MLNDLSCQWDGTPIDQTRCIATVQDYSTENDTCFFRQCYIDRLPGNDLCHIHNRMKEENREVSTYTTNVNNTIYTVPTQKLLDVFLSTSSRMKKRLRSLIQKSREINTTLTQYGETVLERVRAVLKYKQQEYDNMIDVYTQERTSLKTEIQGIKQELDELTNKKNELVVRQNYTNSELENLRNKETEQVNELQRMREIQQSMEVEKKEFQAEILNLNETEVRLIKKQEETLQQLNERTREKEDIIINNTAESTEMKLKIESKDIEISNLNRTEQDIRSTLEELKTKYNDAQIKHEESVLDAKQETENISTKLETTKREYKEMLRILETEQTNILREATTLITKPETKIPSYLSDNDTSFSTPKKEAQTTIPKLEDVQQPLGTIQTLIRIRGKPKQMQTEKEQSFRYNITNGSDNDKYKGITHVQFEYTNMSDTDGDDTPLPITFETNLIGGGSIVDDATYNQTPQDINKDIFNTYVQTHILSYLQYQQSTYTLMAYGQSGSGKTYTMDSMMRQSMETMFANKTIWCKDNNRKVRVDVTEYYISSVMKHLTKEYTVENYREFAIDLGALRTSTLKVAPTLFNDYSSRSHLVVDMNICSTDESTNGGLSFIDLAGNEDLSSFTIDDLSNLIISNDTDSVESKAHKQSLLSRLRKTYSDTRGIGSDDMIEKVLARLLMKYKTESGQINKTLDDISNTAGRIIQNRPNSYEPIATSVPKSSGIGKVLVDRLSNPNSNLQVIVTMTPVSSIYHQKSTEFATAFLSGLVSS